MNRRMNRKAVIGGAVVVLALIGGGAAYAATSHGSNASAPVPAAAPATPTPGATARHPAKADALAGMLAKAEHGEFTITGKDGATRIMDIQRGVVTAADANSVTVRSADGFTTTYTITPTTARGKASTLQPNESVRVVATKTATGDTATRISPVKAAAQPGSPS